MSYTVYVLKDPNTNLIRYVGCTENLVKRFRCHLREVKQNVKKYEWILGLKEKGVFPIMKPLTVHKNIGEAHKDESFFIKTFKDIGHPLLNVCLDGFSRKGVKCTPEQNKRNSENIKKYHKEHPEFAEALGNKLRGRKLTEEQRQQRTIQLREIHNKQKRPVLCFDKNGNFLKKYNSPVDAQNQDGFLLKNVSACCNGTRKTYRKLIWKFEKDIK